MKVVIGTAAYNNLKYTKMFLESIKCSYQHEIWVINNGSTDGTVEWLDNNNINNISYSENRGFSYAYNDMLDYAFQEDDNLLLFSGNDTMFYNNSVDHLIMVMLESDFEMLCGFEILDKTILDENQNALKDFKYKFSLEDTVSSNLVYSEGGMNHSCLIRKKSAFDKVGYYDVNFWPAYFEDNDFARRCKLLGIKYGTVESARFKHFWSRTIYEGGTKSLNDVRFAKNRLYYMSKWGGVVGSEVNDLPFSNNPLKIESREYELEVLKRVGCLV